MHSRGNLVCPKLHINWNPILSFSTVQKLQKLAFCSMFILSYLQSNSWIYGLDHVSDLAEQLPIAVLSVS